MNLTANKKKTRPDIDLEEKFELPQSLQKSVAQNSQNSWKSLI